MARFQKIWAEGIHDCLNHQELDLVLWTTALLYWSLQIWAAVASNMENAVNA